ncbi:hypothetical protein LPJ53_006180, partial [Coemansia erecta]
MSKRGVGNVAVELESSERKRLRNEASASPASWAAPQISEDRKCAEHLSAILQRGYGNSLARSMDTAVQLVQNLKLLQSFDTPYARHA